ncbi:DUF1684 domain-containing protein [Amycolatopsis sp. PS_44_ISF1]|uniref:DUF1684 domain-containing protein n=1 Tax=Amycolatopsis sp. PS_44_ISF1 TaxID=2974917 RepID=UPI0028DF0A46|nr:DUF1684 domain-containing protein [Amycolatopsis sp. PS_44_ISF1]MDT8911990.1 DUF1684 domain-containing protein [Amycolatopsis sp. PS_44_ISF1]
MIVTAARAEGVSVGGRVVDGEVEVARAGRVVFPGGRWVRVEELAGSPAVVVWDPGAPALAGLRGIGVWPWDPGWVVEAEYRPAEPGRVLPVRRLTVPVSPDRMSAAGDVVVDLDGERCTLAAFDVGSGVVLVAFTDETSGRGTPAMGRWLILPRPVGAQARIRVDFNRATLPHHVFSAVFPCPLPLPGNHLPRRIEAGERAPITTGRAGTT